MHTISFSFWFSEIESHFAVQAGLSFTYVANARLELMIIFLLQLPKVLRLHYMRHELPCLASPMISDLNYLI